MSQQPVHHNGAWWSRDPSGLIHYYDDQAGAWKPWDPATSQTSPPGNGRVDLPLAIRIPLLNTPVATPSRCTWFRARPTAGDRIAGSRDPVALVVGECPCTHLRLRRQEPNRQVGRSGVRARDSDRRDRARVDRGRNANRDRPSLCGRSEPIRFVIAPAEPAR